MAETMQTLLTRRSCRSYKPDMPDRKTLETILQAGTYAPTGMGRQSPVILAVTNKALRDRLSQLNAQVGDGPPRYRSLLRRAGGAGGVV